MNTKIATCSILTLAAVLSGATVAKSISGIEGPEPRNQVKYFGEEIILSCTSYFDTKLSKWPPKITWLRKKVSSSEFNLARVSQLDENWFVIPLNKSRTDPHSPKERILHFDRVKYISKIIFPLSTRVEDGDYACVVDEDDEKDSRKTKIFATATVSVISPQKEVSQSSIVPEQSQMLGPFIILALSLVVLISAIFLKFRLN
ncbi:unnamed protein product [Oikopleura dioica]|uniref:Ig-like domain-containing protein n=1 Tax=Oikopleura dioica TaxID=34765 RepID=E4XIA5_OIKDI|nr:unnamed protein product [Oikopleura dioica]